MFTWVWVAVISLRTEGLPGQASHRRSPCKATGAFPGRRVPAPVRAIPLGAKMQWLLAPPGEGQNLECTTPQDPSQRWKQGLPEAKKANRVPGAQRGPRARPTSLWRPVTTRVPPLFGGTRYDIPPCITLQGGEASLWPC